MTLINPYEVHVLSKPWLKFKSTVRERCIFKTIKKPGIHHVKQNGSQVTFNLVLHSRVTFNEKVT